jgi:hypothetical protein
LGSFVLQLAGIAAGIVLERSWVAVHLAWLWLAMLPSLFSAAGVGTCLQAAIYQI